MFFNINACIYSGDIKTDVDHSIIHNPTKCFESAKRQPTLLFKIEILKGFQV